MRSPCTFASVAIVASIGARHASAQHLDVYVGFDAGRITTSGIDIDTADQFPGLRAFGADLGEFPAPPGFGDEPGFFSTTLTPGAAIGFDVVDGLRAWNGSDFGSLASESLEISKGSDSVVVPTTDGGFAPGFVIATADASGGIHDHVEFALSPSASTGVFLVSMRLWTDAPGIDASETIWIVLNSGMDEEDHDAAIEWVESTLVPAPSALALLALGATPGIRRHRRD